MKYSMTLISTGRNENVIQVTRHIVVSILLVLLMFFQTIVSIKKLYDIKFLFLSNLHILIQLILSDCSI